MTPTLRQRLFVTHPEAVNETYFGHMKVAFSFAWLLLKLAGCALIHGIVPASHEHTVGDRIVALADQMKKRRPQ